MKQRTILLLLAFLAVAFTACEKPSYIHSEGEVLENSDWTHTPEPALFTLCLHLGEGDTFSMSADKVIDGEVSGSYTRSNRTLSMHIEKVNWSTSDALKPIIDNILGNNIREGAVAQGILDEDFETLNMTAGGLHVTFHRR